MRPGADFVGIGRGRIASVWAFRGERVPAGLDDSIDSTVVARRLVRGLERIPDGSSEIEDGLCQDD